MKRFDERRVNDLQNIQYQIVNYYQRKGVLPNSLDELKDPIAGFNIPLDPDSAVSYGYEKISDLPTGQARLSFKLCAEFSLASDIPVDPKGTSRPASVFIGESYLNENWQHSSRQAMF